MRSMRSMRSMRLVLQPQQTCSIVNIVLQMKFNQLDIFGSDINFSIDSNQRYKTNVGAVGTICLLSILFGVFFNNLVQFLRLQNVSIYEQSTFDPTDQILLTSDNLTFAIGIKDSNYYKQRHFDLKIQQVFFYGNGSKFYLPFNLVPCEKKNWASKGQEFQIFFQNNKLEEFVCISENFKLKVVGQYGSETYKYLRVSINRCSGKECSSKNQFNDFIKKKGYVQINLAYVNSAAQYHNIDSPFSQYPQKLYYRFVPLLQQLSVQQYFHKIQINTQSSVLPFQDTKVSSSIFFERSAMPAYISNNDQSQTQFFKLMLKTLSYSKTVDRKVQSLDQFLSFLGGIFFVVEFVGNFLFQGYAKYKFHENIFKNTYKIVSQDYFQTNTTQKLKQLELADNHEFNYAEYLLWRLVGWFNRGKESLKNVFGKDLNIMEIIDQKIQQDRDILLHHQKLKFLYSAIELILNDEQRKALFALKWRLIKSIKVKHGQDPLVTDTSRPIERNVQVAMKDIFLEVICKRQVKQNETEKQSQQQQ